jgi:hypothetical protein
MLQRGEFLSLQSLLSKSVPVAGLRELLLTPCGLTFVPNTALPVEVACTIGVLAVRSQLLPTNFDSVPTVAKPIRAGVLNSHLCSFQTKSVRLFNRNHKPHYTFAT